MTGKQEHLGINFDTTFLHFIAITKKISHSKYSLGERLLKLCFVLTSLTMNIKEKIFLQN